jgi:hypothetical protein
MILLNLQQQQQVRLRAREKLIVYKTPKIFYLRESDPYHYLKKKGE